MRKIIAALFAYLALVATARTMNTYLSQKEDRHQELVQAAIVAVDQEMRSALLLEGGSLRSMTLQEKEVADGNFQVECGLPKGGPGKMIMMRAVDPKGSPLVQEEILGSCS